MEKTVRQPRRPKLWEALLPIVVLLVTMVIGTLVWGADPHIPLVLSCVVTALVAAWCGNSWETILTGALDSIKSAVEGELLTAEAIEICDHRKLSCCEVKIRNGNGEIVCTLSGTGYRKDQPLDFASEA